MRWLIAAGLILAAAIWDTASPATVEYPFAASAVEPAASIGGNVEWRAVPTGLLPAWPGPVAGTARAGLAAGDPILPSLITDEPMPADWWAIPLELPGPIPAGTPIRVLFPADGIEITGMVSREAGDFGQEALVAFPAGDAVSVAVGAGDDAIVVMVGAGAFGPGASG